MRHLLLLMSLALTACGPATYEGVKADHAGEVVFQVQKPADDVVATIRSNATRCWTRTNDLAAMLLVRTEIDPATGHQILTAGIHGILGTNILLTIEVAPVSPQSAEVIVFHFNRFWRDRALVVKRWAVDDYYPCEEN